MTKKYVCIIVNSGKEQALSYLVYIQSDKNTVWQELLWRNLFLIWLVFICIRMRYKISTFFLYVAWRKTCISNPELTCLPISLQIQNLWFSNVLPYPEVNFLVSGPYTQCFWHVNSLMHTQFHMRKSLTMNYWIGHNSWDMKTAHHPEQIPKACRDMFHHGMPTSWKRKRSNINKGGKKTIAHRQMDHSETDNGILGLQFLIMTFLVGYIYKCAAMMQCWIRGKKLNF